MLSRKPDLTPLMRYCRKRRDRDGAEDTFEITISRWFVTLLAALAIAGVAGSPVIIPLATRLLRL